MIALEDLEIRGIYRLRSRNLRIGVWTGSGFIGIRDKLGSRFLDTEYPVQAGGPYGTATALSQLPFGLDPRIQLRTSYPSTCYYCGLPTKFSEDEKWQHLVVYEAPCEAISPVRRTYVPLFDALEEIEEVYPG